MELNPVTNLSPITWSNSAITPRKCSSACRKSSCSRARKLMRSLSRSLSAIAAMRTGPSCASLLSSSAMLVSASLRLESALVCPSLWGYFCLSFVFRKSSSAATRSRRSSILCSFCLALLSSLCSAWLVACNVACLSACCACFARPLSTCAAKVSTLPRKRVISASSVPMRSFRFSVAVTASATSRSPFSRRSFADASIRLRSTICGVTRAT